LVIVAPAYLGLLRSLLGDVECDVEIGINAPNVLEHVQRQRPALLLVGSDAPGVAPLQSELRAQRRPLGRA
jgi:hypothetical protein